MKIIMSNHPRFSLNVMLFQYVVRLYWKLLSKLIIAYVIKTNVSVKFVNTNQIYYGKGQIGRIVINELFKSSLPKELIYHDDCII